MYVCALLFVLGVGVKCDSVVLFVAVEIIVKVFVDVVVFVVVVFVVFVAVDVVYTHVGVAFVVVGRRGGPLLHR